MTQAFNLSQLANNLNTSGQLDATDGLVNAVPIANGGTGASTDAAARANLNVPSRTGADASGTWNINITGNAATATSATTAANGGVTSVNGLTGAVTVTTSAPTTAQVLTATAGASVGAVGTYATCYHTGGGGVTVNPGATVAGSALRYAGNGGFPVSVAGPTGTWRCMGYISSAAAGCCSTIYSNTTLWLRIS